ncbi:MAG: DUF1501 domain-containing protein [Gemmataceae bacterium]|nr:DUF1501 domain-containing protein [Gemmataceae bacterium]
MRVSLDQRLLHPRLNSAETPRARSVLLIWLGGGPSHLDLFDPKPRTPLEYRGPFQTVATRTRPGTPTARSSWWSRSGQTSWTCIFWTFLSRFMRPMIVHDSTCPTSLR